MNAEADAFARFEAAGWEAKASGYHGFFEPITTRAVAALLDAAAVAASTRALDLASGPGYVAARAAAHRSRHRRRHGRGDGGARAWP
jgi:hypothetical protein